MLGHRGKRDSGLCRVSLGVQYDGRLTGHYSGSKLPHVVGSILVRYTIVLLALDVEVRIAFEYSKRRFANTLGPDLPVWALLASGSTGGVCPASSLCCPSRA